MGWNFRPFLALDLRLCRGKMSPKKLKKKINIKILKRKNNIDLASKSIN
jgi:hypothetical protein